eukprot:TRINITY_DN3207_c0_g1_i2.p1 TRINITY_DN3207_c0_g1~~TRINITY_DN3207_c0_g1_i2.p1  ORF type:complete len:219 (+),score=39.08 TRINITY_DN3207_c0_g1_i2:75-731(+)
MPWSDDDEDGEGYLYKSKATFGPNQIRARPVGRSREASQGPQLSTSLTTLRDNELHQSGSSIARVTDVSPMGPSALAAPPAYADVQAGSERPTSPLQELQPPASCDLFECARRVTYQQITIAASVISFALLVVLIVMTCLHFYSSKANVYISDFTVGGELVQSPAVLKGLPLVIGQLGAGRSGRSVDDTTAMPVRVSLYLYNPTRATGKLTHAYVQQR